LCCACRLLCRFLYFRSVLLTTSTFLLSFFFNDTAPTEIYTLSLHDALPIFGGQSPDVQVMHCGHQLRAGDLFRDRRQVCITWRRSEEHTSELQSRVDLVCRLLLEKKKKSNQEHLKSIDQ